MPYLGGIRGEGVRPTGLKKFAYPGQFLQSWAPLGIATPAWFNEIGTDSPTAIPACLVLCGLLHPFFPAFYRSCPYTHISLVNVNVNV
jgi:hypothetical protein